MMGTIFRWVIAPAGLILAYAIVESHVVDRPHVMLVSFLSGATMGLYFGLLLLKRRISG
jgi:hypothetical protein